MIKHERLGLVALVGLAAGAAGALLFKILHSGRGEDGPIRVKGGSVTVENDFGWEDDDEDGDLEYTFSGNRKTFLVEAWKNESDTSAPAPFSHVGRVVKVDVERTGGGSSELVFKANGIGRLIDKQKKLTLDPLDRKKLIESGSQVALKKVVVKNRGQKWTFDFDRSMGEKGYITLTPQ